MRQRSIDNVKQQLQKENDIEGMKRKLEGLEIQARWKQETREQKRNPQLVVERKGKMVGREGWGRREVCVGLRRKEGWGRGENPRRDLRKYYCNYTLRFISCVPAPAGVDSIIYCGSLIKIIIRALNRGGPSGSNVRPFCWPVLPVSLERWPPCPDAGNPRNTRVLIMPVRSRICVPRVSAFQQI